MHNVSDEFGYGREMGTQIDFGEDDINNKKQQSPKAKRSPIYTKGSPSPTNKLKTAVQNRVSNR